MKTKVVIYKDDKHKKSQGNKKLKRDTQTGQQSGDHQYLSPQIKLIKMQDNASYNQPTKQIGKNKPT